MKQKVGDKKQWWLVANGDCRQVIGELCGPMKDNMWWCEEVRYAAVVGRDLFETQEEALVALAAKLQQP